jgi:hypothetical protein
VARWPRGALYRCGVGRAWLHLTVLWTFAVAKPLFELFADYPDFLIAQGNGWPDLLLVSLALVLVPPSLMVGLELAASRFPEGRFLHLGFVALLTAAIALQALKDLTDPSNPLLPLGALAVGVGFAVLYACWQGVPMALTVLSPAPLVLLVWFLAFSPAAGLVLPHDSDTLAQRVANPVPVVFVIFDELAVASLMNDSEIDPSFKGFSELAEDATWYPNATTVADNTTRAVPAILTGRLMEKGNLPVDWDQPPSIFDRLAGQYDLHVYEPITRLCPSDLCPRSREGWLSRSAALVHDMGLIMKERLGRGESAGFLGLPSKALEERPEEFRRYTAELEPGRTLHLVHLELPHVPYQYTATGRRYTSSYALPGLTGEQWGADPAQVMDGKRRYLEQLRFTDRLLAELLDRLKATGLYERSLLVVCADHGVSFRPNGSRRNVSVRNLGDIAGVPLFIKAPGQTKGRVDQTPARTIDILPTIGDYLGADWKLEGRSLRRPWSADDVVVSAQFGPTVRVPLELYIALRDRAAPGFDSVETASR